MTGKLIVPGPGGMSPRPDGLETGPPVALALLQPNVSLCVDCGVVWTCPADAAEQVVALHKAHCIRPVLNALADNVEELTRLVRRVVEEFADDEGDEETDEDAAKAWAERVSS